MSDLFIKFIKFGLVGFFGLFVDFGTTWLLKDRIGVNKYLANSSGFMLAVVSNYILNRIWTFESHDPNVVWQFTLFLLISLVGLAMNNGIIYTLTEGKMQFAFHKNKWVRMIMNKVAVASEGQDIDFYCAKIVATGVVTAWNFGANLLITFA